MGKSLGTVDQYLQRASLARGRSSRPAASVRRECLLPAVASQTPPMMRRNGLAHGLAEMPVDAVREVAQSLPGHRVHPRWIPLERGC